MLLFQFTLGIVDTWFWAEIELLGHGQGSEQVPTGAREGH